MNEFDAHVFFGTGPDFAIILAGIHNSEQSGIEVAHWIRTKLAARSQPTRRAIWERIRWLGPAPAHV